MGKNNYFLIIGGILIALIALGIYFDRTQSRHAVSKPRMVSARGDLANYEMSTISIFNSAAPSVVYIFTENAVSGFFGRREVRQVPGPDSYGIRVGMW